MTGCSRPTLCMHGAILRERRRLRHALVAKSRQAVTLSGERPRPEDAANLAVPHRTRTISSLDSGFTLPLRTVYYGVFQKDNIIIHLGLVQ